MVSLQFLASFVTFTTTKAVTDPSSQNYDIMVHYVYDATIKDIVGGSYV